MNDCWLDLHLIAFYHVEREGREAECQTVSECQTEAECQTVSDSVSGRADEASSTPASSGVTRAQPLLTLIVPS